MNVFSRICDSATGGGSLSHDALGLVRKEGGPPQWERLGGKESPQEGGPGAGQNHTHERIHYFPSYYMVLQDNLALTFRNIPTKAHAPIPCIQREV